MTEHASDEIGTERPESPPRPLCDVLAFGVLAVVTLRILLSLATGAVRLGTNPDGGLFSTGDTHIGDVIEWFADYGDGFGVVLAGLALGLVWWQVHSVPKTASPEATTHTRRSLQLCAWVSAVLVLTAAGSLTFAVGVTILHWPDPERWLHLVSSGFYVTYALFALIGLYAARQLRSTAFLLAPEAGASDAGP